MKYAVVIDAGFLKRKLMLEHSDLVLELPIELVAMVPQVSAA